MSQPSSPADVCDPERLLSLVRSGASEALDALTRCYGQKLLAAGRKHCRTDEEARDAVQDTWVIASTALSDFRGEGRLDGWLVRIVASACARLRRGQKNDPARHTDGTELFSGATPEGLAAEQELVSRIEQALLSRDPLDRAVLLLSEVEGYSGLEIAERVGLSSGAVRTRLSRIRAELRAQFGPHHRYR